MHIFVESENILKKVLTKEERCGILNELSSEGKPEREGERKKFFKKLLQNPLTKAKRCDIIV